jgi:ribosomal protein S18 acetylase RimI-like enzyme
MMSSFHRYLQVRQLGRGDLDEAAALLGRGMADNPVTVAAYQGDDETRPRRHGALMRTLLRSAPSMRVEGVHRGDTLVGVAASAQPGRCQPAPKARLRLLRTAVTFGYGPASRIVTWNRDWASRDPEEPHVHLGPVSVDRDIRGQGIGSLLMLRHVGQLNASGVAGYLETDRPEAVDFYRRFGYQVVAEAAVLEVPCWFMRRPAE